MNLTEPELRDRLNLLVEMINEAMSELNKRWQQETTSKEGRLNIESKTTSDQKDSMSCEHTDQKVCTTC